MPVDFEPLTEETKSSKVDFEPLPPSKVDFEPLDSQAASVSMRAVALPPGQSLPTVGQAPNPIQVGQIPEQSTQIQEAASDLAAQRASQPSEVFHIGEQPATVPRFGKEGTLVRGASDVIGGIAEWAMNKPEEALATLTPVGPAIALRYAPEIAKQFMTDLVKGVKGDRQALGRALTLTALIGVPAAAKRGVEEFQLQGATKEPLPNVEALAIAGGKPQVLLRESATELEKLPGKEMTDAIPQRETAPLPLEVPPGDGGKVGAQVREQVATDVTPGAETRPNDARTEAAPNQALGDLATKEPFIYRGFQDMSEIPGAESYHIFNLTEDVPEVGPKGGTVSESALRKAGFDPKVPQEKVDFEAEPAAEGGEKGTAAPVEPVAGSGLNSDAKQEIEMPGGETQGSLTGSTLAPATQAAISGPVKGLHEIAADLAKGLGVPIRFGRLTTNKGGGYFKKIVNLIGSKRAVDMPVVSHEVGHKLDSKLKFSSDPLLRAELTILGDPTTPGSQSSWTKSKTISYKLGEGMAEFTRHWLTDPAKALKDAPNSFAAFEKAMDANKDWGDTMRQAQHDIQVWRNSPNQARLHSHLSDGENPNGTPYTLRQLTRDLVDDLHIAKVFMDEATKARGKTFNPTEDIYVLARLLRGAYGRAEVLLQKGMVDFRSKEVTLGKSLEDALKPVAGRLTDFQDWIVAKRAQELHGQRKETGLLQVDIDKVAADFDKVPEFQEAFRRIKEWQKGILKYALDSGYLSKEGYDAMLKLHEDYVPFHRLFEIGAGELPSQSATGTGRGLNVGKPGSLMRLSGSPRPIIPPLETMVKNAYMLTLAAEKSFIHSQLANLAESAESAKWIEKIGAPKEIEKFTLDKIKKQLENAGADLTGVPDDLLLSFFHTAGKAPFGENIIKTVRNGKPEFYRLTSDLFDTFHALDVEDAGKILRVASKPANLLRAGVTLDPFFAVANTLRDNLMAPIVSKHFQLPFEAALKGFSAMYSNPKLVAEWAASGGKHSIESNFFDRGKMRQFLKEKITHDLTPAERAMVWTKSPMMLLRRLTAISEEATRIGEYKIAYDALRKSGMPEGEARTMAAFESRDRQDFAKGGAAMKSVRMMVPFWNAALQGNVKLIEAFKHRPVKTTLTGLAFITIPKMLEQYANKDDPDYWDRPQWERDAFFLIPAGKDENQRTKFFRIPIPFEAGVLFATIPGRFTAYLHEHDTAAFNGLMKQIAQQTFPNPVSGPVQTVYGFLAGAKGWDYFRGKPIVSERVADLPTDMQWTEQTSLTARHIGKILGIAPMKIDYLIGQTTGGLGKQLTHNVADRAISAVTGEKRTARGVAPGGRFVTSPAGVSSQAVEDFYANLQTIRGEAQRARLTGKGADWAGLNKGFTKAAEDLGKLRKAARLSDSDKEKQVYYLQMAEIARALNKAAKEAGVK